MNSIAGWVGAMGLVGMGAIYPQVSLAEELTGAKFLQWEERHQATFIANSVVMMIIVSGEADNGDHWADCVSTWFSGDQPKWVEAIRRNIARFEDFHPQTTIYATAEKACGQF